MALLLTGTSGECDQHTWSGLVRSTRLVARSAQKRLEGSSFVAGPMAGQKRKLDRLSGLGAVTDSALSAILRTLQDDGDLPNDMATSARSIARATLEELQAPTQYGQVLESVALPLDRGGAFAWNCVNPFAMLNYLARKVPDFGDALVRAARRAPPSPSAPWRVCMYVDEATPGNLLRADNTRRTYAFYWAFEELGLELLSREGNWLLGGVIRSNKLSKVTGGLSAVFSVLLRKFWGQSQNMATSGVTVHTTQGVLLVWAKLATRGCQTLHFRSA